MQVGREFKVGGERVEKTDWNEIFKWRQQADLPNILNLPTISGRMDLLAKAVKDGHKLLDIGANNRGLEKELERAGKKIKYFSFDIDRTLFHDYYNLDDVDQKFDVITAFELVEHIGIPEIIRLFKKVSELLSDNGVFMVSTPNVCHPVLFWRDCTHITPVRYDELYGLLAAAGFRDIKIYRSGKFKWKYRLLAFYYRPLMRLLRMDYVPGIIAVAVKKP